MIGVPLQAIDEMRRKMATAWQLDQLQKHVMRLAGMIHQQQAPAAQGGAAAGGGDGGGGGG